MYTEEHTQSLSGKNVIILGGDGFCGWPTSLRFSALGAHVTIIDNGSRRAIDRDLGTASLTNIRSLDERVSAWRDVTGRDIAVHAFDLARDYETLVSVLRDVHPDIIVHFAEQRSAPFSMMSSAGARYSVDNNIRVTHNLLVALVETGLDPHLVHLGTIGVYGYSSAGLQIPEGYLPITAHGPDGRDVEKEILYPGNPDSLYHLTKALDQQLFAFYAARYGLRITDLHQGVVWGTQTPETRADDRLVNRFDHDPIYGTVVGRFLVQAYQGRPLTVYGSGTQTRAFIHIGDMLTCLTLAVSTPPQKGDRVRILNQIAETSSVNAIATNISHIMGATIDHQKNPRQEPEGNEFFVAHPTLLDLGFKPHRFKDMLATEIENLAGVLVSSGHRSDDTPRSQIADHPEHGAHVTPIFKEQLTPRAHDARPFGSVFGKGNGGQEGDD